MTISYAHSDVAWRGVVPFIEKLIHARGARRILEVGAGANPTFSLAFVRQYELDYALLDISSEELAKAPEGYTKIEADISSAGHHIPGGYDLVFSRMLAEHVRHGEQFHRNIHALLRDGGVAFHFFPTLFAPPFIANRLMPESLAAPVLRWLQPNRRQDGNHGKFPAYYSWCRGPTKKQIHQLEMLGYDVAEYIGFFGHPRYYLKLPWLRAVHDAITGWLVEHPVSHLTSFAYLVLAKH